MEDEITILPSSSILVTVASSMPMNTEGIVEINTSSLLDRGVSVARGIARFNKSQTQVWLTNFTAEHKLINKGTTVAFLEDFAEVGDACNFVCASRHAYTIEVSEPSYDINPALPRQRKEQLLDLLRR